jgi:hypothetical protein
MALRGKLLRISSYDKIAGSNSDFKVTLNNASFVQNVRGVVLKSVSFKHVFPNIYEGNNTFLFGYNSELLSITLDPAWYDGTSFQEALEVKINALPEVVNQVTVTLEVDPPLASSYNKKLKFDAGADTIMLMNLEDGNTMALECGILTTTDYQNSHIADSIPDLGGLQTVYICSSALAGANSAASSSGGENVPIITEIPINNCFGSTISYRAFDDDLEAIIYPNKRQLTEIDIALCTRTGEILDLAQHDLTLMFKIVPSTYFPVD